MKHGFALDRTCRLVGCALVGMQVEFEQHATRQVLVYPVPIPLIRIGLELGGLRQHPRLFHRQQLWSLAVSNRTCTRVTIFASAKVNERRST